MIIIIMTAVMIITVIIIIIIIIIVIFYTYDTYLRGKKYLSLASYIGYIIRRLMTCNFLENSARADDN